MTPRLTSAMLVSSLIRLVDQAGGSATVLKKGNSGAGAILLYCSERGRFTSLQERVLTGTGCYLWQPIGPDATHPVNEIDAYLARRRERDGDLWLIELDIANAERFAAETIAID
ncbi:DUF1491 family protein [Sphingomonas sp.]|uniref:DUF1491 family protein n=1 Tax=Sphingomonas sp. TaxID=28214 RepID=UPI0025F8DD91|nr:DUF1491 family protein [Sphingomonas sp.]